MADEVVVKMSPGTVLVARIAFFLLAAAWVAFMGLIFFLRPTVETPKGNRAECFALAEATPLDFYAPNVASSQDSGWQELRQERYRDGRDIDNAFLEHEWKLMLDRSCEARRANASAKLGFVGTLGATTLVCWVLVATHPRRITLRASTMRLLGQDVAVD